MFEDGGRTNVHTRLLHSHRRDDLDAWSGETRAETKKPLGPRRIGSPSAHRFNNGTEALSQFRDSGWSQVDGPKTVGGGNFGAPCKQQVTHDAQFPSFHGPRLGAPRSKDPGNVMPARGGVKSVHLIPGQVSPPPST